MIFIMAIFHLGDKLGAGLRPYFESSFLLAGKE